MAGFAWGVLVGAFIGNVAIQLLGAIKVGMKFRPVFDIRDADFKKYILLTLPLIVGLGMTFSNEVFFRFFGSFLGTGGLASINYSLRTMMPLVGVFGQASGVASYPFLSRLAAEQRIDEMNKLLNSIVLKIGVYIIPVSAVMIVLSEQIIAILFQHGRFTAEATANTAPVLVIYLAGSFFFAASTIVMRNYYAMQNTAFPMIISTIIAALSIPAYALLSKKAGARGIAMSASAAMFAQFTFLYWFWSIKRKNIPGFLENAGKIFKIAGISLAGATVCYIIKTGLINQALPGTGLIKNCIIAIVAGGPGLLFSFAILETVKIGNNIDLVKRLFKKT